MRNILKNIIIKIANTPQTILKGVFGMETGLAGMANSLRYNITQNTFTTLVFFVASMPLWLVWGVFLMQRVMQIAIPNYSINTIIEPLIISLTVVILLCRGNITYLVNNPHQMLSTSIWRHVHTAKQTVRYTLKYIREKLITAGLYLLLILLLPLLITGSTIVFALAIATVFIIWKLKRTSSIDVFYKGIIIEAVLVVMWLGFVTAPGSLHQGVIFLMILVTTGVFSAMRLNKIAQQKGNDVVY